MANSAKTNNLLAAIRRKAPDSPAASMGSADEEGIAKPKARSRASRRNPPPAGSKSSERKPIQFWFHEEDRRMIREFAAWVAGQGVRPSDSLILRAALHTAKTDQEFLEAYRQVSQLDGRLKVHKASENM